MACSRPLNQLENIREGSFLLIKSFESFELYQSDDFYAFILPTLSKADFLLIKGFYSFKDFDDYLFDVFKRPWRSVVQTLTKEQRDRDYDLALAELSMSN